MENLTFSIDKLLKEFKLHPVISLILFPLLTLQPEEYTRSLKQQIPKFLPEAPDYVMDQKIYVQQLADSIEYLYLNDLGQLLNQEDKIRKLAAKASLSLAKDDKYKEIIQQPEEFLNKIFHKDDNKTEIITGELICEVMWNGKPNLEIIDYTLIFVGVLFLFVGFLYKIGVFDSIQMTIK